MMSIENETLPVTDFFNIFLSDLMTCNMCPIPGVSEQVLDYKHYIKVTIR